MPYQIDELAKTVRATLLSIKFMSDHRKGVICGQNRLFTSIIIKRRRLLRFVILVFCFRPGHVANFIRLLILSVILSAQILKTNVDKLEATTLFTIYMANTAMGRLLRLAVFDLLCLSIKTAGFADIHIFDNTATGIKTSHR